MNHLVDIFGKLYEDTLNTDQPVYYATERDDNYLSIRDAQSYFMDFDQFPALEKELLSLAHGYILDLSSGAGRTALHLQNEGFTVLATDISETALKVCEERGVWHTRQLDIARPSNLKFLPDTYETVSIFGNSIGIVENQENMIELMNEMYNITADDGIVIGDFLSPLPTDNPAHLAYHENNLENLDPIGLVKLRMRYMNLVGDWFKLWLPTEVEFRECVAYTDWRVEIQGERWKFFILRKS